MEYHFKGKNKINSKSLSIFKYNFVEYKKMKY